MDSVSSSGCSTDVGTAAHEAIMAKRSLDQQRLQGAQAVQLIEAAMPSAPAPLPPDATISIRA